MTAVSQAFSINGALAKAIDGFSPRQAQTDMALEVANAIKTQSSLIVEAGTGTGKTFAYLIPAFLSVKSSSGDELNTKIIISTGTKNLQEQLFYKDIPVVKKALASNVQVALLKGRANYLCKYRLAQYQETRGQLDANTLTDLVKVKTWANSTQTGDIGELVNVTEDSSVFPFITSTLDNCLAKDCPDYDQCYLARARQKAINADLIVVNHQHK